jgi:hypothetical protein
MPFWIPILLGGGAFVAAAAGAGAALEGLDDMDRAEKIVKKSKKRLKKQSRLENKTSEQLNLAAIDSGKIKEQIVNGVLMDVVSFLDNLSKKRKVKDYSFLIGISNVPTDLKELKIDVLSAHESFSALGTAVKTGVMTYQAALAGAGLFGIASTGTAIGGISGAAATSATLAWFGGGALAVGGGGMALGQLVLGGVTFAPALLVAGFAIAMEGDDALTEAKEYKKKTKVICEQIQFRVDLMLGVVQRLSELNNLVVSLSDRLLLLLDSMDYLTWDDSSDEDIAQFTQMISLARVLGDVINIPIIDEVGELSDDSSFVISKYQKMLL